MHSKAISYLFKVISWQQTHRESKNEWGYGVDASQVYESMFLY